MRERGAAAVWVLACGACVLVAGSVVAVRATAVLARHRAESAADLAALTGAARIGVGGDPCLAAQAVARANDAVVRSCLTSLDPGGRSGVVAVRIESSVRIPVVGAQVVAATARAARLSVRSRVSVRDSPEAPPDRRATAVDRGGRRRRVACLRGVAC